MARACGGRYFTLLNMFGEFPLVDRHSTLGRLIGTFAAVIAVAVFSVPIGILGDGFGDAISSALESACRSHQHTSADASQRSLAVRSVALG
jgi:hypothetical protein|eukprot:COSAG01_NODE_3539_length_5953_cov_14.073891_2_plen_91_part_00